jgi:hypothetical protein
MKNVFINFNGKFFIFYLIFFTLFLPSLKAQYASFGSGIGLNILMSDEPNNLNINNLRISQKNYTSIGQPSLSLNIDYNFPREITTKFLSKIYNPIFSKQHLQLRGQIIFNQFNISEEKNNSIATFGASFLYFPIKVDENKKTNFFIEMGYKMGWNNTVVDPFNCLVAGIGTRHRLGNDWYWQTNLSYTMAFYDYLDLSGPKGYASTSKDGYFLLNFSLLKPFLTNKEQKRVDQSRDSLAVTENFATSALDKSTKVFELIKGLQNQLKAIEDKVLLHEKETYKATETAKLMVVKVNQNYGHLKEKNEREKVEREVDSLQSILSNISLVYSFTVEKAQFEYLEKNPFEQKTKDIQQEIKETQQVLLLANKFLPRSKDFKFKAQQLEDNELGKAKELVDKMLREWAIIQAKLEKNKARLKGLSISFEKTNKELKNTAQELEKIMVLIDKLNK